MKPGIDPTVDCVFKALLGSEENKNLLIHFLEAVLEPPAHKRIEWVEILNPYNEREFLSDKLSVVDVKARDRRGTTYQIEVQISTFTGLLDRILYGWADLYASQLKKGAEFSSLQPVVSIWILANDLIEGSLQFHHHLQMADTTHGLVIGKESGIHLVELEKWKKQRVERELDRWTYFFREGEELDTESLPEWLDTKEMKQAMETLKMFSERERAYHAYQARLNFQREQNAIMREREEALKQAEAARQQAEAARQQAEAERQQAEAERQQAEAERQQAEAERQQAEAAEQHLEAARQRAEAEQQRAVAEQQRAEAGQRRAEAEQRRAEAAEQHLEAERQQAGAARQKNERLRKLLIDAGIDPGEE